MKKVVIISLFVLFLFACTKEDSFCWTCWEDEKGPNYTKSHSVELCGKTDEEIGEYIRSKTKTVGDVEYSARCQLKDNI